MSSSKEFRKEHPLRNRVQSIKDHSLWKLKTNPQMNLKLENKYKMQYVSSSVDYDIIRVIENKYPRVSDFQKYDKTSPELNRIKSFMFSEFIKNKNSHKYNLAKKDYKTIIDYINQYM